MQITPKGRALMERLLPPHYERVAKIVEKLTPEEQEQLRALLLKMG